MVRTGLDKQNGANSLVITSKCGEIYTNNVFCRIENLEIKMIPYIEKNRDYANINLISEREQN